MSDSDELVERVARALWFDNVDQQGYPNGQPTWDEMLEVGDPVFVRALERYRSLARAALSATPLAQMREENERLREAHQRIVDAWVTNNSEGDDYEEGYEDGLKAAHDIARAALTGEAP